MLGRGFTAAGLGETGLRMFSSPLRSLSSFRWLQRLKVAPARWRTVRPLPADQPRGLVRARSSWPAWASIATVLLGAGLVIGRWLLHSRFLIDWDAVNYALALEQYDIRLGQPHPPGYFLYVMLGRLAHAFVGEGNLALVLVSAFFGLLLVGVLFLVGRDLFGPRAGALAAVLGLTGPTFWFQSSVASSRTAEAFFAVLIAWLCVLVRRQRSVAWAFWLLPFVLAVAAGFRQNILLFMLPLCVYATWHIPLRKRLAAGALLIGGILAWALPMLSTSGGFFEYQRQNQAHWQTFVTNESGVFDAPTVAGAFERATANGVYIFVYTWFICVLGVPVCLFALQRAYTRRSLRLSEPGLFLGMAAGPALIFFTLVHIRHFGHTVSYAPFFALATAAACNFLFTRRAFLVTTLVLVLANLAVSLFYPAHLIERRAITPTLSLIRENDAFLASTLQVIRQSTHPRDTVLVSTTETIRYLDYYLPEYTRLGISQQIAIALGSSAAPSAVTRFVFINHGVKLSPVVIGQKSHNVRQLSPASPWLTLVETSQPARLSLVAGQLQILKNKK